MKIGYMRPYLEDENCQQQLEMLQSAACEKYITEEHASAKRRIELETVLGNLHAEDVLVVARLFALADSTRHLVEVLDLLDRSGAYLVAIRENLDTRKPQGMTFRAHAHSLLNLQTDVVSENTKRGMYEAKQKGAKAGRPRKLDDNVRKAIQMYESRQCSLAQIKEETGISKTTLYRYMEN